MDTLGPILILGLTSLVIILTPTVLFTVLTVNLFNTGEKKRIEGNITEAPSTIAKGLLYFGLLLTAILIIFNLTAAFLETIPESFVYLSWDITIFWTLLAWIPTLMLLLHFRDKGLKYRKWIILFWILHFLVFLSGIMNPIPQSV